MMKQRNAKLKDLQAIALSSTQLQNHTEKQIPILTYRDIYGKSLDKLLKNGAFILLYLWERSYGHWIAVIRHNNGKDVEFFDSYGKKPDFWLSKNSYAKNKKLGQEKPYLLNKIMRNNKYDYIYYNPFTFQDSSDDRDILTCGRHTLTRIRNRDLSLDEYKDYLDDVMKENNLKTYDEAVTFLTQDIDEQH